jgi:hypothetical protein
MVIVRAYVKIDRMPVPDISRSFIVTSWLLISVPGSFPQQPPDMHQIGPVSVQANLRSRLELWDWFEAPENNSYAFSGNILRTSFTRQRESFDWQIELAVPFLLALPENSISPAPQLQLGFGGQYYGANKRSQNAAMIFPKQAFIRWKNLFGSKGNALRIGRFEFIDGTEITPSNPSLAALKRDRITQRLIGNFGWTHVGRSFDGAHYSWTRQGLNVTVMGGIPTRGVFQVDGWGWVEVATLYGAVTGQIPGRKHNAEWRALAIYYQDWRGINKTDNLPEALRSRSAGNIRIGTFGGHYLHTMATAAGSLDALLWGVGQAGKWGGLNHGAGAIAVEGGWQPDVLPRLRPWLRAGYFRSSGDHDPEDDDHGTFFQVLPTPRPYARFPFFNLMNNQDIFGTLMLRPHPLLAVKGEIHDLQLSSSQDLWYQGGGAFQPWSFGYIGRPSSGMKSLARLYDVSIDYTVNARLTLSGYFGHARGGSVIRAIYPSGRNGSLGYLEASYKF